jgi:hypothetical protein
MPMSTAKPRPTAAAAGRVTQKPAPALAMSTAVV